MGRAQNSIMLDALQAGVHLRVRPSINEVFDITRWVDSREKMSAAERKQIKSLIYELSKQALQNIKPSWHIKTGR
ncbi:hypothetical protein [Polynucleobacter sp. JS-Fieb-80-E5]|uniref:hypothetical protein n=1 Tax=Polynucleobacter sp. JS-Fieb-80-E5 TaxID=2081050 RepID=UPI001C0AC3EB|nr:hypothetical protein [Polynucleobacter sp. JS-Fieb-80-E5]